MRYERQSFNRTPSDQGRSCRLRAVEVLALGQPITSSRPILIQRQMLLGRFLDNLGTPRFHHRDGIFAQGSINKVCLLRILETFPAELRDFDDNGTENA